jgi:hypothetical protein
MCVCALYKILTAGAGFGPQTRKRSTRMKKLVVIFVFVLISAHVFAEGWEWINTTEGSRYVSIEYKWKNGGQETANSYYNYMNSRGYIILTGDDVKLTKGEWESIGKLLGRYETTRGETYQIYLSRGEGIVSIVVEFTSNTQYSYWVIYVSEW